MQHAEVILTFIFMNSLMAPAPDFQLSGGCSKLMCEGSQYQHIRKKLLPSKRRCEFRVLVTGGNAGIGSTQRRLLLWGLLSGHKQKVGTVSHTSNLESLPTLTQNDWPCQRWNHMLSKPVKHNSVNPHLNMQLSPLTLVPTTHPQYCKNTHTHTGHWIEADGIHETCSCPSVQQLRKERGCNAAAILKNSFSVYFTTLSWLQ